MNSLAKGMSDMEITETGRSPDGSGSRPTDRAADGVSPVPASIPNADDGSIVEDEDPFNKVYDADERLASFVAALGETKDYDAKRELWLQAIDDSQFECDLRTLFGVPKASGMEARQGGNAKQAPASDDSPAPKEDAPTVSAYNPDERLREALVNAKYALEYWQREARTAVKKGDRWVDGPLSRGLDEIERIESALTPGR